MIRIYPDGRKQWHKHNIGYLCENCYKKKDYKERYINARRTNNQDPNSSNAIGDLFEELTHRWKGVKILSIESDHYNGPLDHSVDSEEKIPNTKGRLYDSYNQSWSFAHLEKEWFKEFDYEICYCISKDGKNIERIYVFPIEEILFVRSSITITKNPIHKYGTKMNSWYDKYRANDETTRKVNDIFQIILKEIK